MEFIFDKPCEFIQKRKYLWRPETTQKTGRNRKALRVGIIYKNNIMKIFAKLLMVVVVFTMTAESYAQTFGVRAGLNLSNMFMKDDEDTYSDDYKMNPGFHVGPTAEFPINDMLSFEAALLFSTKGFKIDQEQSGFVYKGTVNCYYIDLPLTAKATFNVGGLKIYGALGPYVGMGLSGKVKSEVSYGGDTQKDTETLDWGSDADNDDFKRLDFGVTAGAGIEISSIRIGVTYGYGLANISPDTEGGNKINNRVLGVSVGYKFGGK
jgi:hypothetical protein